MVWGVPSASDPGRGRHRALCPSRRHCPRRAWRGGQAQGAGAWPFAAALVWGGLLGGRARSASGAPCRGGKVLGDWVASQTGSAPRSSACKGCPETKRVGAGSAGDGWEMGRRGGWMDGWMEPPVTPGLQELEEAPEAVRGGSVPGWGAGRCGGSRVMSWMGAARSMALHIPVPPLAKLSPVGVQLAHPWSLTCLTWSQVVSREDHAGAGGAAAVPPRDGAFPGAGEHQLPRRLHPVRELRGEGGALPHHLLLQQAEHRRGGLLRKPHAAGGGEVSPPLPSPSATLGSSGLTLGCGETYGSELVGLRG